MNEAIERLEEEVKQDIGKLKEEWEERYKVIEGKIEKNRKIYNRTKRNRKKKRGGG